MNHPQGMECLYAKGNGTTHATHAHCVLQSTNPMDQPGDVSISMDNSDVTVGGLMDYKLCHNVTEDRGTCSVIACGVRMPCQSPTKKCMDIPQD